MVQSTSTSFEDRRQQKHFFGAGNVFPADGSELDLRSEDARGVANKLHLQKDDILENLRAIQIRNGLKQTEDPKNLLILR